VKTKARLNAGGRAKEVQQNILFLRLCLSARTSLHFLLRRSSVFWLLLLLLLFGFPFSASFAALLTSSALFFHFFEFVTTRFMLIRNILSHWWMFGSTSDFELVEIEDDSIDFFDD